MQKDASQNFDLIVTTSDRIYVKLKVLSIEFIEGPRAAERGVCDYFSFLSFYWIHAINTDVHELYRASHVVNMNKFNRKLSLAANRYFVTSNGEPPYINCDHLI